MENKTLIFIPDISGFTQFINKTAIEHSQHIISELLEIILKSNMLELAVSEIEGDAILFYKNNSIPSASKLIEQSKEMFLNFHSHLNEIEKNNVCQCGACKTASNLSLKFIAHIGETKQVIVNKFNKLIGSDLILAHRLLKNNIKSREYLLLTEAYAHNYNFVDNDLEDWAKVIKSKEIFENFGEINSRVILFNELLKIVPKSENNNTNHISDEKPDIRITIDAPINLVHEKLTDHEAKYDYVKGIKRIEAKSKINRVNTKHTCVFDNFEIDFITKSNEVFEGNIEYLEEAKFKRGFRFITAYKLRKVKRKTELSINIFIPDSAKERKNNFFNNLKEFFLLNGIKRNTRRGIINFKKYCENLNKENNGI